MTIHPSAIVDASARIADRVEIGPFCVVGPRVELGGGVRLLSHAVIQQDATIGPRCVVSPGAVLGGDPQHLGYKGEPVRLEVGADNVIREHVTMNRGTPAGGGVTRVGSNGLFMASVHIGHDAQVGDHVTMATGAAIGGHARIGDRVFMGGLSAVHQFGRVGTGAIVGGLTAVTRDVIPYGSVWAAQGRLRGLNLVGLKRRGYDKAQVRALLAAYRELFEGEGLFEDRLQAVRASTDLAEIREIVDFIRADGKRPICLPEA